MQGMRPRVLYPSGDEIWSGVVVLIVDQDSVNATPMPQFQSQKMPFGGQIQQDPRPRPVSPTKHVAV